jgi:serine/threonine protein kinase
LGESLAGGKQIVIKVGLKRGAIDREAAVLTVMRGATGFPKLLHYGQPCERNPGGVLVMELLGPSLDDLCRQARPYTYLSGPTVLRVGKMALARLHRLHLAGFVHNDVKPANLLLGARSTRQAATLHLIDFGLTTLATDMTLERHESLIGTPSFASLAGHHHRRPMRPVDDLESLMYTLAYLAAGSLPWQGLPDSQVASMKHRVLVEGPWILSDGYLKWTSPKVVAALHALWAEVMRCRGDGREEGRVPVESINYDACLAIMRGGSEEMGEAPFDWEDGAHGGKGAHPIFGEPSQGDTVWSP